MFTKKGKRLRWRLPEGAFDHLRVVCEQRVSSCSSGQKYFTSLLFTTKVFILDSDLEPFYVESVYSANKVFYMTSTSVFVSTFVICFVPWWQDNLMLVKNSKLSVLWLCSVTFLLAGALPQIRLQLGQLHTLRGVGWRQQAGRVQCQALMVDQVSLTWQRVL